MMVHVLYPPRQLQVPLLCPHLCQHRQPRWGCLSLLLLGLLLPLLLLLLLHLYHTQKQIG
jgi:hypothetical protein